MSQELDRKTGSAQSPEKTKPTSTAYKVHKALNRTANSTLDLGFIVAMIFLLLAAVYVNWDSMQVYTAADPIQYLQYKPSPPKMMPFEELQEINSDVIGWLTVYDTNIDYPVVKGEDNDFYLNHGPTKEPEGSGSIYMHYKNNPKFTDFNTILFGHHMTEHKMFGDLDLFLDEDFWNTHEYGNLIYDSQNHGLQFIAMLEVDAYDHVIYRIQDEDEDDRIRYINHIYETAMYVRGISSETLQNMQKTIKEAEAFSLPRVRTSPLTPDDHLILMSTCSADITNGRFILVAKLLDHPVENPFPDERNTSVIGIDSAKITLKIGKLSVWAWIAILLALILLTLLLYILSVHLYKKKLEGESTHDQNKE